VVNDRQAAALVATLRMQAADYLVIPAGPIRDTLTRWTTVSGSKCAHLEDPQPVFGLLCEPGARMCFDCLQATAETISVVEGVAACDGCTAEIDLDHMENAKVIVCMDAYLSVLGHACPDCRSICDKENHA
jgi:hypothetical protein